jgi:hypothetical protein
MVPGFELWKYGFLPFNNASISSLFAALFQCMKLKRFTFRATTTYWGLLGGLGYGEFFRRVLIFYALFDDVETPIAYISRS